MELRRLRYFTHRGQREVSVLSLGNRPLSPATTKRMLPIPVALGRRLAEVAGSMEERF